MSECQLCKKGDPAITVRCYQCRGLFHLHQSQLEHAPNNSLVMANCPNCNLINCWSLSGGKVSYSGPVYHTGQPVTDLRRKR